MHFFDITAIFADLSVNSHSWMWTGDSRFLVQPFVSYQLIDHVTDVPNTFIAMRLLAHLASLFSSTGTVAHESVS